LVPWRVAIGPTPFEIEFRGEMDEIPAFPFIARELPCFELRIYMRSSIFQNTNI
jgi:hypothetical protein